MEYKLKIVTDELFYKAIEIILESRVTIIEKSNIVKSRFNIEIEEMPNIRNIMIDSNFIKVIILYHNRPIEQWTIQFTKSNKILESFNNDMSDLKLLYQSICTLLKCVFIQVKVFPAYTLKGSLSYNIIQMVPTDIHSSIEHITKYSFTPIDSIFGVINISIVYDYVIYKIDTTFKLLDIPDLDEYPFYIPKKNSNDISVEQFYNLLSHAKPLNLSVKTKLLIDITYELEQFKKLTL
jgi:hypothetical protein